MVDDYTLLEAYAAKGSNEAFAELVKRHVDLVYSVSLRVLGGDRHAAEDAAQATFLALAKSCDAVARRRSLAGWLYVTAHNLAAQRVRSERRRQAREQKVFAMDQILNTPEVDWTASQLVLDEAMRSLPERDREAVLLRFFERQGYADVGVALGVSADAARMRVDRALERLRDLLAKRGIHSTAGALAGGLVLQVSAAPPSLVPTIVQAAAGIPAASPLSFLSQIMNPIAVISFVVVGGAIALSTLRPFGSSDAPQPSGENLVRQESHSGGALRPAVSQLTNFQAPTTQSNPPFEDALRSPALKQSPTRSLGEAPRPPEVGAAESVVQRTLAEHTPFFEQQRLTSAQSEEFGALLSAHVRRRADLAAVSRRDGLKPDDVDVESLESQADLDLNLAVRSRFGPAIADAFEQFTLRAPMRELAAHLKAELDTLGLPITPAQQQELVEILQRHRLLTEDGQFTRNPRAIDVSGVAEDEQTIFGLSRAQAVRRFLARR